MKFDSSSWPWERMSATLCVLVTAAFTLGPYLLRVDLFNNDAAHHIFWLYRYSDPGLFPGDVAVDYFQTSAPWGYRALYSLVAPVGDLLSIAEWLSVALLCASALLAWKLGVAVGGTEPQSHALLSVAAMCFLMQWSQQQDLLPPLAFQRTFALPLLLLTLWALVRGHYVWLGVSWVAAALLYPVVLPVQGLTAGAVYLRHVVMNRTLPTGWVVTVAAGALAVSIAALGVPVPTWIGPPLTYEQAMQLPEFGPGGRLAMYGEGLGGYWLRDHRTGLGWSAGVLGFIGASVLLVWRGDGARRIPFAAWAMMLVGFGLWSAMRAFPEDLMFGLYLPNRHARWAIGVFGIMAISAGASVAVDHLRRRKSGSIVDSWNRLRIAIAIVAPVAVAAATIPYGIAVWRQPVDRDLENVYAFLATLPKDTLVAAHPDLADFVPVRTRRSVLTSTEISMAWMDGYYRVMKPRVEASLRAAYAVTAEELDAELTPLGVDVMLTGPSVWQKSGYFKPFDELFNVLIERGRSSGFVLKNPPANRVLFQSGDYYVVRVTGCPQNICP